MSGSLIQELKRRNVFRVAAIYIVVSWLLIQIGDVIFPALRLPDWTTTMLVAFLLLGLPVAIIFAWAFELTPDGVVRTTDVPEEQSITQVTGQKINHMIIGVLVVAVIVLLVKLFWLPDASAPRTIQHDDRSIALLPFKNQSASAENAEFFAGGLHDELLTLLSRLGDLKVISRTSVERLDPGLSVQEIGALLGVATVLEGQVQRAGNRLRINVQLIDTSDGGHLWANIYDSELTAENVFDVQSDIARTISDALQAKLSPDDVKALQTVPTTNTAALELYLRAMQIMKRNTYDALRQAEEYLEEVTSLDPSFADAWAALAHVRGELFMTGASTAQQYVLEGGAAVDRALSLDARNAAALAEKARVLTAKGDLEAAEASFLQALAIAPRNARIRETWGEWLRTAGRLDEARDALSVGLEYDPLSTGIIFQLGRVEMFLGNPDRNIELGKRILELDPAVIHGYVALLQANIWRGRFDEAWPWYIKTIAADRNDYEIWAHISVFLDDIGAHDVADRYMARAETLGPDSPIVAKCKVLILENRGRRAEALAIATRTLAPGIDDRWDSDRTLLRSIRDAALDNGNFSVALERYRARKPSLFDENVSVHAGNVNIAADLALLLQDAGDTARADELIAKALQWYDETQPPGVYGYIHGLLRADLLALSGNHDAAIATLQDAVARGYRWQWQWSLASRNYDAIRERPEFKSLVAQIASDMAAQLENLNAIPNLGEFDLRDQ